MCTCTHTYMYIHTHTSALLHREPSSNGASARACARTCAPRRPARCRVLSILGITRTFLLECYRVLAPIRGCKRVSLSLYLFPLNNYGIGCPFWNNFSLLRKNLDERIKSIFENFFSNRFFPPFLFGIKVERRHFRKFESQRVDGCACRRRNVY